MSAEDNDVVALEIVYSVGWQSATSITLFLVAGALFILFVINERVISSDQRRQAPLFPWRFLLNRAWLGVLITSFLSGIPHNTLTITLPQRFQIVEGETPLRAGERLIPFNFFIAIGSILANIIAMKTKLPPIYLLFTGGVLESIGVGLLSILPSLGPIPGTVYLYEILAGIGLGFIWGLVLTIPPSIGEERDKDIAGGAIFQTRVFGGAIGLSIASSVLNSYLKSHLGNTVGSLNSLLANPTTTLASLSQAERDKVLTAFAAGYSVDAKIMAGFYAGQILSIALLWKRPQIALKGIGGSDEAKNEGKGILSNRVPPNMDSEQAVKDKGHV
ncbi:MAG: hypothetical protein Q9160_007290 [Pyrenula sp. 1 TL-2023]